MKILIITGSNRSTGVHQTLISHLQSSQYQHEMTFLEMSGQKINSCIACEGCTKTAECVLPQGEDDFFKTYQLMKDAEAIFFVIPIYAPIPSKISGLFERLISMTYFGCKLNNNNRSLENKKTAVIYYGAGGIADNRSLKIMLQQLFTDDYSFKEVTYDFLDNNLNHSCVNLTEYIDDILIKLEKSDCM